jgi:hypothetical protein
MKAWFEVSREGLKELQAGKPKHFIARELIQNAWDEQIKVCLFNASWEKGIAMIEVVDDNPTGFRDITDAFILFKTTTKRSDPSKRGRFNIGEKQVLSMCEKAIISTTKGTVIFDKKGRVMLRLKKNSGSEIKVWVKMSENDLNEIVEIVKRYLVPEAIKFIVNGEVIKYHKPYKTIQITLGTENETNGVFTKTQRKTFVDIHKTNKAILYEMGLPVTEIDCQFSIDVQQKVPLSIDRDTVPVSYLKALYAEVLNVTYDDVEEDNSSNTWVRQAMADKRISGEAVKEVVEKRYGDKVVVANPFDPVANDDALAHGYNVIRGAELSKEEWANVRNANAIKSSTQLFGRDFGTSIVYVPDENMLKVALLAKKIAKKLLDINLGVDFYTSDDITVLASFGNNQLSFNVTKLGKRFFDIPVSEEIIDLIVHELGHSAGHHTEESYHKCITKMTGQLVMIALTDKSFYKI